MKNIVFVILDEFADWEAAFLSSALNDKNITKNYTTNFASIDKNLKKSMGNLKVLPDLTLKAYDNGCKSWNSHRKFKSVT